MGKVCVGKAVRGVFAKIKKISFEPLPVCVFGTAASGASLLTLLTGNRMGIPVGLVYLIHSAGACGLGLAIWSLVLLERRARPVIRLKQAAERLPVLNRMMEDDGYRTILITVFSLPSNAFFAMMKAYMGLTLHSAWFGVLAGYDMVLCMARFVLMKDSRRLSGTEESRMPELHEWKAYRLSGMMLLMLTLFLICAVLQLVYTSHGYAYEGMLIYVVACYDFGRLTSAAAYMIRTRRKHRPLIQAVKTISFAATLVSLLSLQSAMFASFGSDTEAGNQQLMNGITGAAVCLALAVMGICMTWQAQIQIRNINGRK